MSDRLDEIQARVDAATEGPWELFADDDDVIGKTLAASYPSGWPIIRTPLHDPSRAGIDTPDEFSNADFIAHSREDIPWLLAQVRVLTEREERAVELLVEASDWAERGDMDHQRQWRRYSPHRERVRAFLNERES